MKPGVVVFSVLMILALACSSAGKYIFPAATATTTATVSITGTSAPTATKTPTLESSLAPQPSATDVCPPQPDSAETLASVQKKTAELVPGAKAIWYDDFICRDFSYGWGAGYTNPTMTITVSGSVVTISARMVKDVYSGLGRTEWKLGDNTGMLMLFRIREGTTANLGIYTGTWQKTDFRGWYLNINNPSFQTTIWGGWEGTSWLSGSVPANLVQPDTWYYLLIRLGNAGQVTMKVWKRDNPANRTDSQRNMGSQWAERDWISLFQVYEGTLEIDKYWEMAF